MTFPLMCSVVVPSTAILKRREMLAKPARKVWATPKEKAPACAAKPCITASREAVQ